MENRDRQKAHCRCHDMVGWEWRTRKGDGVESPELQGTSDCEVSRESGGSHDDVTAGRELGEVNREFCGSRDDVT